MAEKEKFFLKDIYSPQFYDELGGLLTRLLPQYDHKAFTTRIFDEEWDNRELKDRMKHTAFVLKGFLPESYLDAVKIIVDISRVQNKKVKGKDSFPYMFLPTFVEHFGLDHYDVSITAMTEITQFTSCEFAVRPFYLRYREKMLEQTRRWAEHPNFKVRRLASEGCRPRLPWGKGVPYLKKEPELIIPILDQLKNDPAEWVRRSVANNLNDISKDHPELIVDLAHRWKGQRPETDWVVRHACRTLLKQGHTQTMRLFGFGSIEDVAIKNFQLDRAVARIGEELNFNFDLHNNAREASKIRLEYGLYFKKANGSLSRKVFQIGEKEYPAQSITPISKKQHFKIITTRKYYPGEHKVSIIVNGEEVDERSFKLAN